MAIILIGVIGHYSQSLKAPVTPQHSAPVVQPTPAPQKPSQEPLVKPQPVLESPAPPPPAVSAPRARLVLYKRWAGNGVWEITDSTGRTLKILVDPAPRAQLVRLPSWQPGALLAMRMPYDESFEVRGVFRGYLASEGLLPRSNNSIGDTWVVGTTPWVWITTPGTTAPTWVDPDCYSRSNLEQSYHIVCRLPKVGLNRLLGSCCRSPCCSLFSGNNSRGGAVTTLSNALC